MKTFKIGFCILLFTNPAWLHCLEYISQNIHDNSFTKDILIVRFAEYHPTKISHYTIICLSLT